ncbi:hypothetical protein BN1723_013550, partial [Verticillium longisporum]
MAASVSSWLAAATPTPTLASVASKCATTLSVGAVLSFGPGHPLTTLTHAAILETPCAAGQTPTSSSLPSVLLANAEGTDALDAETSGGSPQFSDFRDAFYESTFPVCYVLAATTVTAYMLVIMLFVTPRSFLDGGVAYLGRSGFTGSSPNGISIGGRPWLQKVAAMTVAISLTIATADTFRVAEEQYAWGVQNADQLQSEVMDSTELKIMRLISDTFLWLAQAQTLIRLFPRQREKVIIKWTAFALITLQVIFSALNSFYYLTSGSNGNARPQSFVDAVPALSYLFHLSLGLLYAAWVIYYALMKKRYAFYHPLMKNMPLISALSILSILIPVVFFVLDISRPEFIGWGEYVRWAAYWAQQAIVLLLGMEKPRKDFKELVGHHIVSLALIALSYRFHFTYIGLAVYITHDISDLFLATSKLLNYIDHPLTGPYFAVFMFVWIYLRHYINLRIIWSLLTEFQTIGPFELNWATEQYKCRISQELIRPLARRAGLRSRAKQARFMEQMYTAVYFFFLGPAGMYVMRSTPVWYYNTAGMYENFPHRTHAAGFKLMMEKPRKDFKELVGHHIVSLALIALSYRFHFTYIGLA